MATVEIYTQFGCPYCSRAIHLLKRKGIQFQEIDAPHGTAERQASIERSGGRTSVPQIFIDGRPIGGCDDLMSLDAAGKLDPLLSISTAGRAS
jgi:glutaredoxin 3